MARSYFAVAAMATILGICTAACSTSDSPADPGDAGNVYVKCDDDKRVIPYTPNMEVASAQKKFKFKLVSADPAPPQKNHNKWKIRIVDQNGAEIPDGVVTVPPPFMPDHGHGSSVTPSVIPTGDGNYDVGFTSPLHFFMPGVWRITVNVKIPNTVLDSAEFYFCVPG
ncbi:FixH family protein [Pendulispora albinea]|uniref:FixH family protein n=1 Tax=Pendulispora albinea TaxID=2741071 RepID=A0ABZ2M6P0_9BACT